MDEVNQHLGHSILLQDCNKGLLVHRVVHFGVVNKGHTDWVVVLCSPLYNLPGSLNLIHSTTPSPKTTLGFQKQGLKDVL